jgi:hypothetical protein
VAIRGVAQLIEHSSKANKNEILAAIMLLVYYECVSLPTPGQHARTGAQIVAACPKRPLQHRGRTP